MRVLMLDHHGKSVYLTEQLKEWGFDFTWDPAEGFDLLLLDTDHPDAPPRPFKHLLYQHCVQHGIPVGLYPHGALPVLDYDGWRQPLPVAFELVHGPGHKRIYETVGLRRRVEVVGWSFSEVVPAMFEPFRHVVFAPIHPWDGGENILDIHEYANQAAYEAFLKFPCDRKTVRMYGVDTPNGITHRVDGVDYTESDLTLGVDVIDSADAVISYGTFACTSLARGKPVVMIDPYPAHWSDDGTQHAARFDEYKDMCRYPASIGDGPLEELFTVDTSGWADSFIGGPLDVEKVAYVLRQYRPNRAQRRRKQAA